MPNWVANRITIKGDNIDKFLSKHIKKNNENNEEEFDFETIVPVPKSIAKAEESEFLSEIRFLETIEPLILNKGIEKMTLEQFKVFFNKKLFSPLRERHLNELDKLIPDIHLFISNRVLYGCYYWYDFNIKYWGCKWNASNTCISKDKTVIYFDTPWCPPLSIFKKLGLMHPELTLIMEFAEEQTGFYSGRVIYEHGSLIEDTVFDTESKEAYDMSFDLWGEDEYYAYDVNIGNYVWVGD